MTKLIRETKANSLNIGIQGNNQTEINERFYSFWNHGATDGEFYWMNDGSFGYFCTTEEKLKKALVNASLFKLLNESPFKYKGNRKGAIAEARLMADKEYSLMSEENFTSNLVSEAFIYSAPSIFNDSVETPIDTQ